MNRVKKMTAAALAVAMAASLTACDSLGGQSMEKQSETWTQGFLDLTYKGQFNEDFLELMDLTEDEAAAQYDEGLGYEADFFMYYISAIENQEDPYAEDLREDLKGMYKEIYAQSKYTVGTASKLESGNYAVEVDFEPIEIMDKVTEDDLDALYDQAMADCGIDENYDWDSITDEQFEELQTQVNETYARLTMEAVKALIPEITYGDSKTQIFQIKKGDDGYFTPTQDDIDSFDAVLITY